MPVMRENYPQEVTRHGYKMAGDFSHLFIDNFIMIIFTDK